MEFLTLEILCSILINTFAQGFHLLNILRTEKSKLKLHAVDKRDIDHYWLVRHSVMMTVFHHLTKFDLVP